ncbi:Predicted phospholipase, patatin/cPLA2 family [Propionibacterium cyclohexanicum]|uniref:Predicted phospholipase, patatin/cPLA2 family n=1 Tax=Propionibacterium cyclohexanicum TaxID=64702 RepID=A0A1H9QQL4_9ACTN|nr:patatin family protein [Propionibacterium cyclohexanicum]SER62742.1 Predicted phospholipase, patatin/cPLA2 family [Propionibacterium cyclohexanicum]
MDPLPHELYSNVTDTALIFEGGGMRASYTSALVCAMLRTQIHVNWVAGISAGSSNTVNYVSRDIHRAAVSFVDFAADPRFGGPVSMLRGHGWFNAEYIYEQSYLPGQVLPFDYATYSANPAATHIGAFRADTGEEQWFTRRDAASAAALVRQVRASSTMPGLMPMVTINGIDYVDGALGPGAGIALPRAQEAGFTKFLVVLTRPRDYRKPPMRASQLRFLSRLFRRHPAITEALATRPARYNRIREELFDLESGGQAYLFVPHTMQVASTERRLAALRASFAAGKAQAHQELAGIAQFLGVDSFAQFR